MLLVMLALAAPAVGAPEKPVGAQISPLTVTAAPKTAPPADATISIGADADSLQRQAVSIWPAQARAAGIGGRVTLTCKVDIHGLAESCRIAAEDPPGRGFGAAAMALRPTFKLTPKVGPDGPEDALMNIAVVFDAKASETNLNAVMSRSAGMGAMPTEDGNTGNANGHHEINGRDIVVYHNPIAMRGVTIMDSRSWIQAPSFDELAAAYPAQAGGLEGYAVAHCRMESTGALTRCAIAKELPTGHGFGKAAIALAARFRVSPAVMAQAPKGAPIEADVPIRFPAPAESKDRTVRAPIWLGGFDLATALRDFNPPGAKPGSPGAQVKCSVGPDGGLVGCVVELTSPDGRDYDAAAVALMSKLRMTLWSAEAGPVSGGVVHINVKRSDGE